MPRINGYLSRLDSKSSFEVDGRPVVVTERTERNCTSQGAYNLAIVSHELSLGDHLLVFGRYDRKKQAIRADYLCQVAWRAEKIAGAAVIEEIDGRLLHADGRILEITSNTVIHAEAPRHGMADAQVNDWIHYRAVATPNGRYSLQEISLAANAVSERAQRLRDAQFMEFTPPDLGAGKTGSIKFAHLARRYNLSADPALAERLSRIGNSLVPAFQKALPPTDPVKIDFHFYSIAGLKLSACLSTAPGDIFMPDKLAEKLTTDGDLAAILATCIADLIEKQPEILAPKAEANTGVLVAGLAAGLVVPGVGLVALAGTSIYGDHLQQRLREQSARVSLDLLTTAGYPVAAAPHAWELAEAKHLPLKADEQPATLASYLYQAVAERERTSALLNGAIPSQGDE